MTFSRKEINGLVKFDNGNLKYEAALSLRLAHHLLFHDPASGAGTSFTAQSHPIIAKPLEFSVTGQVRVLAQRIRNKTFSSRH